MADWWKYPAEIVIFEGEWSDLLDGDTIVGDVACSAVGGDQSLIIVNITTTGTTSLVKISGGQAGVKYKLVFGFTTASGQFFDPVHYIEIRKLK